MEDNEYPMPRSFCGARTRTGGTCRQPAMKNGRCRMHGGKSLSGAAHGMYKHGRYAKGFVDRIKELKALLRKVQMGVQEVVNGE